MSDYTCEHGGIAMGRDCPDCHGKIIAIPDKRYDEYRNFHYGIIAEYRREFEAKCKPHFDALLQIANNEQPRFIFIPPNAGDHRAGPDDQGKAEKTIVAGSGASTCWAGHGQEGKP